MKKYVKRIRFFAILISLLIGTTLSAFGQEVPPQAVEEKVVYLTFDDGPIPNVTDKILEILKENDVKATFFVVGKEIKQREAILQRMYKEGHGIGLHTYSHDFKQIYRNEEIFIGEMEKTLGAINEVLGESLDIKIIRFPGGSAGRLNQSFFDALERKGYKIFDWNVDLQDGVHTNLSPKELLTNAKKCRDKSTRKIILAHCNSKNTTTCKALPEIIAYYKEQGYTFKAIDNTTEAYYYRFKK